MEGPELGVALVKQLGEVEVEALHCYFGYKMKSLENHRLQCLTLEPCVQMSSVSCSLNPDRCSFLLSVVICSSLSLL